MLYLAVRSHSCAALWLQRGSCRSFVGVLDRLATHGNTVLTTKPRPRPASKIHGGVHPGVRHERDLAGLRLMRRARGYLHGRLFRRRSADHPKAEGPCLTPQTQHRDTVSALGTVQAIPHILHEYHNVRIIVITVNSVLVLAVESSPFRTKYILISIPFSSTTVHWRLMCSRTN